MNFFIQYKNYLGTMQGKHNSAELIIKASYTQPKFSMFQLKYGHLIFQHV